MALKLMLATAVLGGAGWMYLGQDAWSRASFVQAATVLLLTQVFVVYGIWSLFVCPFWFSPLRHLPTAPGGHWLLGHGKKILVAKPAELLREWALTIPNEGLIRYYWLLNRERLLITSPKALAEVLVTNNYAFQKPENFRSMLGCVLGYGAMTTECGKLGEAEFEAGEWASRVTLDIIGVAGLGRDFHAIQDDNNDIVQTYKFLFKPRPPAKLLVFLATLVPTWLLQRLPLEQNRAIDAAAQTIKSLCQDLIREKRKKMMAYKGRTDVDILSVAIESGQFTDENLVGQLMTFLAAGHETTSTALTWAIYELSRSPEMQKRLRNEIREKLPFTDDVDAKITSLDIDHMPYLDAVCNEALRFFSPGSLTIREATHDTTIQGVPVKKGTRLTISPFAVNVDPKLWGSDASQFNPDRWISAEGVSDETNKRAASGGAESNYAFLSFLHGPRSCIGTGFAKGEFACLLAAWIGRFECELVNKEEMDLDKIDVRGGVAAKPANGLYVKAKVVP
ncbi:cytochrome P450 [Trichoderma compactum]